ncbi:toprim domain-containing protein [Variovorax sp. Sphag1AA]|uniref:DUF7146 domain-containing protein n=1 Tax=Variovorax sp. Sphag1AA TaxID=2587027 RepID=UPI00160BCF40|nr:toprim domain-containing protein [Variovorax sp. Sphag1AA]MBB3180094.1 hypothetical protein [Variovorax sp. Sphag1AA]
MTAAADLVDLAALAPGEHRVRCPNCGRDKPGDKTLGVTVDQSGFVAHCHRCHHIEHAHASRRTKRVGKPPPIARAVARHERLSDAGVALWQSTRELFDDDSPAARYLRARACPIPRHSSLRWLDRHAHPSGYCGPCLVALIRDVLTGEPISLHCTWLTRDGTKAPIDPARRFLPGHRKQGGVIELAHPSNFAGVVGVAEGIETGLAMMHVGLEFVWSAIDAGNLAALPVVPGVAQLWIAADGDPPGRSAAESCAARYRASGVDDVRIWHAPDGLDLADLAADPEETP